MRHFFTGQKGIFFYEHYKVFSYFLNLVLEGRENINLDHHKIPLHDTIFV